MNIVKEVPSIDGITTKFLQKLSDGFIIETTYVNRPEKHIICLSSQVGCPIGCTFCVSGMRSEAKFKRNLTVDELMEQISNVISRIDQRRKPILISFMGEGEPFLNFDNLLEVLKRFSVHTTLLPLRFAISTSGICPDYIKKLADTKISVPLKLQVSLHAPSDIVRAKIIPRTRLLWEIVDAVRYYQEHCSRPVEFNYVLLRGINDGAEHARSLGRLLGRRFYLKINEFNEIRESCHKASSLETTQEFCSILESHGVQVEHYKTDGSDIQAACGQLSYHSSL